jgi:glycine/D-amino acid oxidase-like deaminating enzyme
MGYHRLPDVALDLKEKGGIDIGYGELPWIRIALSENDERASKEGLSLLRSQGYHEAYWIEGNDLQRLYPDINPLSRGGMVLPYLQVEPYRYTLGLAQAAEKMGVNIRQGEVVGFHHQGSKITSVALATGTKIEADIFILAMGPWSRHGTSYLGKELPILINREQCLRMQVPKRLPPYALASPAGQTIIPKVDGDVILGHAGLTDLQTSLDVSLTTEEAKMVLINDAIELLPTLNEAELVEQRGDFECWSPPPNRIQPVLGRLPEWKNAYIATRFGTLGMMLSLGAGRLMADFIIAGGRIPDRAKTMMEVLSPARL